MKHLELSDLMLLEAVKNSLNTTSVIVSNKKIGQINMNSGVLLKEALLLDFSHNCLGDFDELILEQFPQSWWFIFHDNHMTSLMANPPRFIGLLDISDNNISLESLTPFENCFVLRLNVKGNDQISSDRETRSLLLKKLHQVWVLNDDFVKTEETTTWGSGVEKNLFRSGGWQAPNVISDKQRDTFDVILNQMPQKYHNADQYKLDYVLDDYLFQAFVHNSAPGTKLGEHKPMPVVNCNNILIMKHSHRLDLAVLLTAQLYFQTPYLVMKQTMEKLMIPYMSPSAINDLIRLPYFVLTALVNIIFRICRKELVELEHSPVLASKKDTPNLVLGHNLFDSTNPPTRDVMGFRFVKGVRHYLLHHTPSQDPATVAAGKVDVGFSELEFEILNTVNDIPTKATLPEEGTDAYMSWIPFVARHTLVLMTKVPSCPPLTQCQTSKASQSIYNQLGDLLKAAAMTYQDLNINTNGPKADGRNDLKKNSCVLSFGQGLPTSSYSNLLWNKSELAREYLKPWDARNEEQYPKNQESHDSNDITDLSIGEKSDLSIPPPNVKLETEYSKMPYLRSSDDIFDDDISINSANSPSSAQREGRPWSMSLQTHLRSDTKSLESFYLSSQESAHELSPVEDVPMSRPVTGTKSPTKTIVTGFSTNNDRNSHFVLAAPERMDDWTIAAGREWRDIGCAPLLIHPLSRYPVYIKRQPTSFQDMGGGGGGDDNGEYDIIEADRKDWNLFVKERQRTPNRMMDGGEYDKRQHRLFEEAKLENDFNLLSDKLNEVGENNPAGKKLLKSFVKSRDPAAMKEILLKEMGTTRNLRFQKSLAKKMKIEFSRQRKLEEDRRRYSYYGIKLESGSVMSHDSYNTLETKKSDVSDKGINLTRVSWNTFVDNRKASFPQTVEDALRMTHDMTFMTSTSPDISRPPSPSKAQLSHVPRPLSRPPGHAYHQQEGTELGWDSAIPLTQHVQKALKYSSVYTNSEAIDWGTVLASGREMSTWYPRQEKVTYTLGNLSPVNAARMTQLQLPPNNRPPPPTAGVFPVQGVPLVVDQNSNRPVTHEEPAPSGRASNGRQRLLRPDRTREKFPLPPKRVIVPALTSNFTNYSLADREPVFVEVTQIQDESVSTSVESNGGEDTSIFNGSVHSDDIQREYSATISVDIESATGDISRAMSRSRATAFESDSVGSASLSCGSGNSLNRSLRLKQQQREEISLCTGETSQLNERSSYAIPILKVPEQSLHQPSLNFIKRNRRMLPRILAQVDPLEARWVKNKNEVTERLNGTVPLSICRAASNKRPINPSFKVKKSKLVSKSTLVAVRHPVQQYS